MNINAPEDIPMEAVTPSEYLTIIIDHLIPAGRPVMCWGPPGIGKSDLAKVIAARALGGNMIDFRLAYFDAVDMHGIPYTENGRTRWAIPDIFPNVERDGETGLWHLDELLAAPIGVQPVAYQIVLDRRVGDYHVPPGWYVMASSNLRTDRAVSTRMSTALATRFVHLQLVVSVDDWCKWAIGAGLDSRTIGYIRLRPAMLHAFDPMARTSPNPRTWAFADKIVQSGLTGPLLHKTLAGTIGAGAGTEFYGYLKAFPDVNPDAVLLNPDAALLPPPDRPDQIYAICGALAERATPANFDRVIQYADRLPADFATALVRCATTRDASLVNTAAFTTWSVNNGAAAANLQPSA